MNLTQSETHLPDGSFQNLAGLLNHAQSVDLPHLLVAVLFVFVLRANTTYLPVSVPAYLLSSYQEWLLRKDGLSTIKYSLCSILVCWFGTFAYRLATRRMMMRKLVCHPSIPFMLKTLQLNVQRSLAYPITYYSVIYLLWPRSHRRCQWTFTLT
jgi:hypothetical protein